MTSSSYPRHAEDWQSRFISLMASSLAIHPDVDLSVWAPEGILPIGARSLTSESDRIWLSKLAAQGGIAHLLRTNKPLAALRAAGLLQRLARVYRKCEFDLVHVNWAQNALPLWGTDAPALITVLGSDFGLLRMPGMRIALRAMLAQRRVVLAPNAEWMVPGLIDAFGDVSTVQAIPFGVDPMWLHVERRPKTPSRWIAVTRLTRAKLGELFVWGDGCFGPKRELHLYGPMQEEITIPSWVTYHGPTHPEALAKIFTTATGLITLSRHDEGRPQVMLEAMAATLPIVATDISGHQDVVRHGVTGWLVRCRSDVSDGLSHFENPIINKNAGDEARSWAVQTIGTWGDCASRYVHAYHSLQTAK